MAIKLTTSQIYYIAFSSHYTIAAKSFPDHFYRFSPCAMHRDDLADTGGAQLLDYFQVYLARIIF